jgi:hypothetical protein
MRALCPVCGFHHDVVRVLDDGHGDSRRDIYQVAPLASCDRSWISDKELLEARARFGHEPIEPDDELE